MNSQTKPAPCTASIENDHTHGRQHCTRPAGHTDSHASPPIAGEGIAGQAGRIYWDDAYVGAVPHQPAAVSAAVAPPTNHGLSVQHADALYDAIATPGPGERESFDDQHARVCAVVREILDELTPTPADKAAVLHETADAVAQMRIGAEDPNPDDHVRGYNNALDHVGAELRRMADETATETPDDTLHACPGRWGGPGCRCFDDEPAAGARQDEPTVTDGRCTACGHTVCDGDGPCGALSGNDFCTCPGPAAGARQDAE